MKNLGQFFDQKRFFEGKKFVVTDNSQYVDYDTKKVLGRTIEVAVSEDNTRYIPSKNGNVTTNLFEKMKVKVITDPLNYESVSNIQVGTPVTFSDFTKASLWVNTSGKVAYMDLSLECRGVNPVSNDSAKESKK